MSIAAEKKLAENYFLRSTGVEGRSHRLLQYIFIGQQRPCDRKWGFRNFSRAIAIQPCCRPRL